MTHNACMHAVQPFPSGLQGREAFCQRTHRLPGMHRSPGQVSMTLSQLGISASHVRGAPYAHLLTDSESSPLVCLRHRGRKSRPRARIGVGASATVCRAMPVRWPRRCTANQGVGRPSGRAEPPTSGSGRSPSRAWGATPRVAWSDPRERIGAIDQTLAGHSRPDRRIARVPGTIGRHQKCLAQPATDRTEWTAHLRQVSGERDAQDGERTALAHGTLLTPAKSHDTQGGKTKPGWSRDGTIDMGRSKCLLSRHTGPVAEPCAIITGVPDVDLDEGSARVAGAGTGLRVILAQLRRKSSDTARNTRKTPGQKARKGDLSPGDRDTCAETATTRVTPSTVGRPPPPRHGGTGLWRCQGHPRHSRKDACGRRQGRDDRMGGASPDAGTALRTHTSSVRSRPRPCRAP